MVTSIVDEIDSSIQVEYLGEMHCWVTDSQVSAWSAHGFMIQVDGLFR